MNVYKICPKAMWQEAERIGRFEGAPVDLADGFIHLSTAAQLRETAARHFAGQADLVLAAFDEHGLGSPLRYEASRGGALFPHLYAPLPTAAASRVVDLPLGPDGSHVTPPEIDQEADRDPAGRGWVRRGGDRFMGLVGPIWWPPDGAADRFGFLAEERHLNRGGVVHGGMVMTFADQALGLAAWAQNGNRPQVTIQLDTHFISGLRAGEFAEACCRVVRRTRSLLFMAGEIVVEARPEPERVVAMSQGVWKMRSRGPTPEPETPGRETTRPEATRREAAR